MPAVQTTYTDNIRKGVPGALVDMTIKDVDSATVQNAGGIPFGAAVSRGTLADTCKAFTTGDTFILGIAVKDRSAEGLAGGNGYAQYESAAYLRKGKVWVTASVAVLVGDPVWVIPATGAFAKTNASSAVQIAGATYETAAGIGELAVVRLNG